MLALIPARGGSKGLPKKNVLPFAGRPLIAHTITQALSCPDVSRVVVSTDCPEIAACSREAGAEVPFLRPATLATDSATSLEVFQHAFGALDAIEMMVLQPTSPLRSVRHLRDALELYRSEQAESLVSCVKTHPLAWNLVRTAQGFLVRAVESPAVARRQDSPDIVSPNGSIYIVRQDCLARYGSYLGESCVGFLMPFCASIDIDTLEDFRLAELLFTSGLYLGSASPVDHEVESP